MIIRAGIGAAVGALLLGLPHMLPALASDEPLHTLLSTGKQVFGPAVTPDDLVRWDFTVDPGVSTEPLKDTSIKKIAYGRTSTVHVVETSTGVYSSDALTDPHIQYPGIAKHQRSRFAGLAFWTGHGWRLATPFTAGSFVNIVPFKGGNLVVTNGGTCVVKAKSLIC